MEKNTTLKRTDIIVNAIITVIVLIVGLLLIGDYNEAFYVENSAVRSIFNVLTQVGSELGYVFLLAASILAINKKYGRRLIIGFMLNQFVNSLIKDVVKDPRPDTNIVDGEPIETSYGFPSGHTQNGVAFWGFTFFYTKNTGKKDATNTFIKILSIFFMIVLPISRVIIGVHDLQDIVGGFVIGMIILNAYMPISDRMEKYREKPVGWKIGLGFLASFLLWITVSVLVPDAAEGLGQPGGLLMAGAVFFPIEEEYVKWEPEELGGKKKLIAGVVGLLLTLAVYFGLSAAFGSFTNNLWLWRTLRYFLVGAIVIMVAPYLLKKMLDKND